MTTTVPTMLTVAEAAAMPRLRERTLRDYAHTVVVPSIRIGRPVRFVEADLQAHVDGLRASPGPTS
jgi:excisionase family DNA binding protein